MIRRVGGYLVLREGDGPPASRQLEEQGYAVLTQALDAFAVGALRDEVEAVFAALPPDRRGRRPAEQMTAFRYEMLNRSPRCQQAVGHPAILAAIEPLLGDDCHVIANTAWWNSNDDPDCERGGPWHLDAGPHVPRPAGVPWDDRIPYPVFAIGVHILLRDCPPECGPTGVIPRSHRSGRLPPRERLFDPDLTCDGERGVWLTGRAGDVVLFVSDTWHRRMPATPGAAGRLFLQAHYARRDIAQRLRPPECVHQLAPEAVARAASPRARTLVGLHSALFYDG